MIRPLAWPFLPLLFAGDLLADTAQIPRSRGRLAVFIVVVMVVIAVLPHLGFSPYQVLILKRARLCILSGLILALVALVLSCLMAPIVKERFLLWFFALGISLPTIGGIGAALFLCAEAPALHGLDIVHAPHVEVSVLEPFSYVGSLPLPRASGAVMVTEDAFYVQTADNVLAIGNLGLLHRVTGLKTEGDRQFISAKPIRALHDFLALPRMVLVIADDQLLRTDGAGGMEKIATLPGPGFRFGQRVAQFGQSSRILIFGNVGERGMVFDLKPDGDYTKVAEVRGTITAAAGAFGSTAVAVEDRVVLLTPRFEPGILFVAPKGVGPIYSIQGLIGPEGKADDVVWLFAAADGVFALEDGAAYLAVAGMGGALRAHATNALAAYLYDGPRRAAVQLSF